MDIIQKAILHLKTLSQYDKTLIQHYTHEMDLDDWKEIPLEISYQVVNFILKQYIISSNDLNYIPDLITVLTEDELSIQINNAKRLQHILDTFPKHNHDNDLYVYKGFMLNDVFFQQILKSVATKQVEQTNNNKTIVLPYFVSTSVYLDTALRFTDRNGTKYVCRILISKDIPVSFIRETCSNGTESEDEVLLNIGGQYSILGANFNALTNVYIVDMKLLEYQKHYYLKTYWKSIKEIAIKSLQNIL